MSGHLDFFAAGLEDAATRAVLLHLDAHAVGLAGRGVVDRHVGLVDRHGLFHDAAGGALHGVGLGVLLHQVDAFDDEMLVVLAQHHAAALALVLAGQDDDFVTLADLVHGGIP